MFAFFMPWSLGKTVFFLIMILIYNIFTCKTLICVSMYIKTKTKNCLCSMPCPHVAGYLTKRTYSLMVGQSSTQKCTKTESQDLRSLNFKWPI